MKCNAENFSAAYLEEFRSILEAMVEGMCSAKLNESISHNFIVQMIPHHEAAIRMSENVLKYTDNHKLEAIANGIITEQTKSIENMQAILNTCSEISNDARNTVAYRKNVCRIMNIMINGMRNACSDGCINCDFIREMIPHHIGAVRMSKNALQFHICPELRPILNAIIASQERGICQMRMLSKRLGCR